MKIIIPKVVNTISIVPREYVADSIIFYDEEENKEYKHPLDQMNISQVQYWMNITDIFPVREGRWYVMIVLNGLKEVYRDKVFATAQDIDTYSINKGKFKEHKTENEFIIIE